MAVEVGGDMGRHMLVAAAGWWRFEKVASGLPSSAPGRSGDAALQAMLVVIVAVVLRRDLIESVMLLVGGDMAAGQVGGGPGMVAGARGSSLRVGVLLRGTTGSTVVSALA